MNKKDVMNWLQAVEDKATNYVKEEYETKKKIEERKILDEGMFTIRIYALQKKVNELHAIAQTLAIDMHEDKNVHMDTYGSVASILSHRIGKDTLYEDMANRSDFRGTKLPNMKEEYRELRKEVSDNYNKVRMVMNKLQGADKCIEYLKEIGFDVSELKTIEETALLVEIDKTKLFVCGDNK